MTQGDKVTVVLDLGAGYTRDEEIVATVPGGSVVPTWEPDEVHVHEFGRGTRARSGGPVIRSARFRRSSVIAVIEQPKRR